MGKGPNEDSQSRLNSDLLTGSRSWPGDTPRRESSKAKARRSDKMGTCEEPHTACSV